MANYERDYLDEYDYEYDQKEPKRPPVKKHAKSQSSTQFTRYILHNVCLLCITAIVLALTIKVIMTLFV